MNTKLMTLLACSAVLALPVPASAATDYFLTFKDITGGSVDEAHKGAIDIDSFSWGLSVANSGSGGSGGGAGKPVFSDFSGPSRALIFRSHAIRRCCQGHAHRLAVLDLVQAGGKAPFSYLTMTFTRDADQSAGRGQFRQCAWGRWQFRL